MEKVTLSQDRKRVEKKTREGTLTANKKVISVTLSVNTSLSVGPDVISGLTRVIITLERLPAPSVYMWNRVKDTQYNCVCGVQNIFVHSVLSIVTSLAHLKLNIQKVYVEIDMLLVCILIDVKCSPFISH